MLESGRSGSQRVFRLSADEPRCGHAVRLASVAAPRFSNRVTRNVRFPPIADIGRVRFRALTLVARYSPQHSRRQSRDLCHRRCSFGIMRSVEIIGETMPPFDDMKKLSLGQPGIRQGEGRRFHKQYSGPNCGSRIRAAI